MKLHSPDEPVYTIGVVARLLDISAQTLRQFEREGIIAPSRTETNIRLYSQNELVVLRRVCELVKLEGVNIPGVRAVLRIERHYGLYDLAAYGDSPGPEIGTDTGTAGEHDETEVAEAANEAVDGSESERATPASTRRHPVPNGWLGFLALMALMVSSW